MFLLVSVRHVGASPYEHQHVVSIQISISLCKTFLRISRIRYIPLSWILAKVFVYVPPFISQILNFIYWMVLSFYFDLLWMAWHWKPAITMWFALQCLNTIPILTIIAQENIRIKYSWTPLYWKALTSSLGKGLKLPRNSKLLNTDACRCGQQTLPFLSSQTILTEG